MRVTVLAFASVSDLIGRQPRDVDLDDGATIGTLKRFLESQHEGLAAHWAGLAVAVNGELVTDSRELEDADEVALLPPVSGGSPAASAGDKAAPTHLSREQLDPNAVTERVRTHRQGAVVVFLGDVRNHQAGRPVDGITYTAYEAMAEQRLTRICQELQTSEAESRVAIVHRLGDLAAGETSVVIAVSSPHRAAAYELSRLALERLKAEVPIWKQEHYGDGDSQWREEESLTREALTREALTGEALTPE